MGVETINFIFILEYWAKNLKILSFIKLINYNNWLNSVCLYTDKSLLTKYSFNAFGLRTPLAMPQVRPPHTIRHAAGTALAHHSPCRRYGPCTPLSMPQVRPYHSIKSEIKLLLFKYSFKFLFSYLMRKSCKKFVVWWLKIQVCVNFDIIVVCVRWWRTEKRSIMKCYSYSPSWYLHVCILVESFLFLH